MKTQQISLIVVCFFSLTLCLSAQSKKIRKSLDEAITPEKVKAHVEFLASDNLLGRKTPSPGIDSAAAYISREFKRCGLLPVQNSYFQEVPLIAPSLREDNQVEVSYKGVTKQLAIKTDFVPFFSEKSSQSEGKVVFVGYGITAPEVNYDDYQGVDVKGKIVLLLSDFPNETDSSFVRKFLKHSTLAQKTKNALEHGAIGALWVTNPLNHVLVLPQGYPWPSLSKYLLRSTPILLKTPDYSSLPVVHVSKEIVNLFFESFDSLKSIQASIDKGSKPRSMEFNESRAKLKITIDEGKVKTNNVVGFWPGSDSILKKEIIIVGAHYDHVGFNKAKQVGQDSIFNGADDNASGTSGVLAIAEAFSKCPEKPKRSVLFIAFSAEERGLLGSKAYVNAPLYPLEKTVAMINLDMIGCNSEDSIHLESAHFSPDLAGIVKKQNKKIGFNLYLKSQRFSGGSDHATFYRKGIPFVFFFAGLHPKYHKVEDNPDIVSCKKIARVAKLGFVTAWYIANDNKYYSIIKK